MDKEGGGLKQSELITSNWSDSSILLLNKASARALIGRNDTKDQLIVTHHDGCKAHLL